LNRGREVFDKLGPIAVPSSHVLRSKAELEAAESSARQLGLVPNPQRIKTWDNLLAVRLIAGLGLGPDDPIVDLGCRSGILLTWLDQLGYRDLSGCDLQAPYPPLRSALSAGLWSTAASGVAAYARHHKRLFRASVEQTGLPEHRYSIVTSMSVIEHGVDVGRFLAEVARLLQPGGSLVISTDYWPTPIDLGNLRRVATSRGPDRIFDRVDVLRLCETAVTAGFVVPGNLALDADEAVVSFAGYRYTFLFLALRRGETSAGVRGA
jgi:SAM-dependent methyltransferase